MYRITTKTTGKYNNVRVGSVYCLTKKEAREMVRIYFKYECDFIVEKFIRIAGTVFCWSDYEVEDSIYPDDYWEE